MHLRPAPASLVRAAAGVLALGAALLALLAGAGSAQAASRAGGDSAGAPAGHVVVLGIDGLQWSDITAKDTPTLYALAGHSDIASLVVRAASDTTCPADGWMTLGSGSRSSAGTVQQYPPGTSAVASLGSLPTKYCAPLPQVPDAASAIAGGKAAAFQIPDYHSRYIAPNAAYSYAPVYGSLEAPIAKAGGCVAASGAGATLAAANSQGRVSDYLGPPSRLAENSFSRCALTLVDLGGASELRPTSVSAQPVPPVLQQSPYSLIDAEVAALLKKLPANTTVVVAGLADNEFLSHLHAVMVSGTAADGASFTGGRLLYTSSTRQPGLVQTLDLTPSLLRWVGLTPQQITAADPKPLTGAAITSSGSTPGTAADPAPTIADQVNLETANYVYGQTNGRFVGGMANTCMILMWVAIGVFLTVRWLPERLSPGRFAARLPWLAYWRKALMAIVVLWAALFAAITPASFLANFTGWSASSAPGPFLYTAVIVIAVVLGLIALAVCQIRALRDLPLAPAGLLSLATLAIIGLDVMTGSHLQAQTPFGLSYTIGGRFFGIGNSAIGVYCASAMIGSAFIASLVLPRRGPGEIPTHQWPDTLREAATGWLARAVPTRSGLTRLPDAQRADRRRALILVGAIAVFAIAACGWPTWGAKVGGTIAMVPGFVLLLFLVAGLRITWRKLALAGISGVVLISALAVLNYLQPAGSRSHLGNFVGSIFDGTWSTTLHRKIDTALSSVHNDWFSGYVPWILGWCLVAVVAPRLIGSRSMALVYAREPLIRCALWLTLVTVIIGMFVDDSAVLVPKMALFVAFPLAVLSAARTLDATAPQPVPVPGESVPDEPITDPDSIEA
jgi:hypothetical protein